MVENKYKLEKQTTILKLPYTNMSINNNSSNNKVNPFYYYIIEISTCNGDIELILSENKIDSSYYSIPKPENNDTSKNSNNSSDSIEASNNKDNSNFNDNKVINITKPHSYVVSTRNRFIRFLSNKNIFAYIRGIKGEQTRECQIDIDNKHTCKKTAYEYVNYTIRYTVLENYKQDIIENEGHLNYSYLNNKKSKIEINWKGILTFDYNSLSLVEDKDMMFYMFSSVNKDEFNKMQSSCYLSKMKARFITKSKENDISFGFKSKNNNIIKNNVETSNNNSNNNSSTSGTDSNSDTDIKHIGIDISNIIDNVDTGNESKYSLIFDTEYNRALYLNIVGVSAISGLSYSYTPIEIFVEKPEDKNNYYIISITLFTFIVVFVGFYFYRKFRIARLSSELNIEGSGSLNKKSTLTEEFESYNSNDNSRNQVIMTNQDNAKSETLDDNGNNSIDNSQIYSSQYNLDVYIEKERSNDKDSKADKKEKEMEIVDEINKEYNECQLNSDKKDL